MLYSEYRLSGLCYSFSHVAVSPFLVLKYLNIEYSEKEYKPLDAIAFMYQGTSMGRINAIIADELESKLRVRAAQKYLRKKGGLGLALTEAIKMWLKEEEGPKAK